MLVVLRFVLVVVTADGGSDGTGGGSGGYGGKW